MKKPVAINHNSKQFQALSKTMTKIELCFILITALKMSISEIKLLTDHQIEDMPAIQAILLKSIMKSYDEGDFSLILMILHKIFGNEQWGTEYLQALRVAKEISVDDQMKNLKALINRIDAKEKELADEA